MANDVYTANADGSCRVGRFNTTALENFGSTLSAASWGKYTGTNLNVKIPAYSVDRQDIAILETDELRKLTNWSNKVGYNRTSKLVNWVATSEGYFAGVKNYRGKMINFDLKQNNFSVTYGPLPLVNEGHCYDRNSSIPDNQGRFYCTALVSTGSPKIYRRELTGEYVEIFTLSTSNVSGMSSGNLLCALDVFPEMGDEGSVITFGQRGALVRYDIATGIATLLHTAATDNRHYYGICVYINGQIIFGGGQSTNQLYRLESNGIVTNLTTTPPHPINCQSNYKYLPSPIDGENACYSLENDTLRMYRHDLTADSWTDIGASPPVRDGVLTQTAFCSMRGTPYILCFHGSGRVGGEDVSELWIYRVA